MGKRGGLGDCAVPALMTASQLMAVTETETMGWGARPQEEDGRLTSSLIESCLCHLLHFLAKSVLLWDK